MCIYPINTSFTAPSNSSPNINPEIKSSYIFPGDSEVVTGRFKDIGKIFVKPEREIELRMPGQSEIDNGKYPTYVLWKGFRKLESNVDLTKNSIIARKPELIVAQGTIDKHGYITPGEVAYHNEWVITFSKVETLYHIDATLISESKTRCMSKEKHIEVIEIDDEILRSLGAKENEESVFISVPTWGPDGNQEIMKDGLLARIRLENTEQGEPTYEYYGLSPDDKGDYIPEFLVPPDL